MLRNDLDNDADGLEKIDIGSLEIIFTQIFFCLLN